MHRNILTWFLGLILPLVSCTTLQSAEPDNGTATLRFELSFPGKGLPDTRVQPAARNFKVFCFNDDGRYLFAQKGRLDKENAVIKLELERNKAFRFLFLVADEDVVLPELAEGGSCWDLGVWTPGRLPLSDPYAVMSSCGDGQGLMRVWSSAGHVRVELEPLAAKVVLDNGVQGLEIKSLSLASSAVQAFWGNVDPAVYEAEEKAPVLTRGAYEIPLSDRGFFYLLPDVLMPGASGGEFRAVRGGKEETVRLALPEGRGLRLLRNKVYYIRIRETEDKALAAVWATKKVSKSLKVLSQNLWGLDAAQALNYFEKTGADILCAQECGRLSEQAVLARGYHILSHTNNGQGRCSIISRLPIAGHTPLKYGAYLDLGDAVRVLVMNCHGAFKPYGPYQLNGIEYGGFGTGDPEDPAQVARVVEENRKARQQMVDLISEELDAAETDLISLSGDFNEPSWLDWTEAAKAAGLSSAVVEWPATRALFEKGLDGDAYRTVHPDPVAFPGFTWSPKPSAKDTKDRIDLTLYRKSPGIKVKSCRVIGESEENADIVISPWIFDHRGVLTEFEYTR